MPGANSSMNIAPNGLYPFWDDLASSGNGIWFQTTGVAPNRKLIVLWDKDWNLVKWSKDFSIMGGHVEFCVGLALKDQEFLLTFGFQDNAAYILTVPESVIEEFLND